MRRLSCALLIVSAGTSLAACGSSNNANIGTRPAAGHSTTTVAAATTPSAAAGPGGKCANAVPQSVAPPSGQWPTPSGYLTYSKAAQAAGSALRRVSGSGKLAAAASQAAKAATEYRKAASQPPGSANNPYQVARATLDLEAAAHVAASARLPACAKSLQHLALNASGTLGQPANPTSCGPGNIPVLGGCVSRKGL